MLFEKKKFERLPISEGSKDTEGKFVLNIDIWFAYIIALKTDRWE
jgi:hypothetical protein